MLGSATTRGLRSRLTSPCVARAASATMASGSTIGKNTSSSIHRSQRQQQSRHFALTAKELPDNILNAEYAVRGELVIRSEEIAKAIAQNTGPTFPFERLVACNIGNPQAVGQHPLTFHRQVLSALTSPHEILGAVGIDATGKANTRDLQKLQSEHFPSYPLDVLARAVEFQRAAKPGAYSHSKGAPLFRRKVADYIERRDRVVTEQLQIPVDVEDLYITDGASPAVKTAIELLIRDENDVILIPIPQYPLYSATIARGGGNYVGYPLLEKYDNGKNANSCWQLDVEHLNFLIEQAKSSGKRVRGIAVINPGNPTGNVLSKGEIEQVVELAEIHELVILADEVYQANVYSPEKEFVSFREVLHAREAKSGKTGPELFSFHSISKGYYGECGLRGGYMHLTNVSADVHAQIYKLCSMFLCSNTVGQAMVASIMNPPVPGEPSHALYEQEKNKTLDSMKKKAILVHKRLNEMPGINCMPIEGAMYAFPQVTLPEKFCEEAKKLGKAPDTWYCIQVLEQLGMVTVPGNGFGQREGTFHFRTTILPPENDLVDMLNRLETFQKDLHAKYA